MNRYVRSVMVLFVKQGRSPTEFFISKTSRWLIQRYRTLYDQEASDRRNTVSDMIFKLTTVLENILGFILSPTPYFSLIRQDLCFEQDSWQYWVQTRDTSRVKSRSIHTQRSSSLENLTTLTAT